MLAKFTQTFVFKLYKRCQEQIALMSIHVYILVLSQYRINDQLSGDFGNNVIGISIYQNSHIGILLIKIYSYVINAKCFPAWYRRPLW